MTEPTEGIPALYTSMERNMSNDPTYPANPRVGGGRSLVQAQLSAEYSGQRLGRSLIGLRTLEIDTAISAMLNC